MASPTLTRVMATFPNTKPNKGWYFLNLMPVDFFKNLSKFGIVNIGAAKVL